MISETFMGETFFVSFYNFYALHHTHPRKKYKTPSPNSPMLDKRFAAFLIDLLIFYFLIFVPSSFVFFYSAGLRDFTSLEGLEGPSVSFLFLSSFLFLLYKSSFEFSFSQTPGKYFLSLEVRGIEKFGDALLRNLPFLFPPFFLFDLFPLVTSDQRLFERISHTQVLYVPKLVIEA